MVERQWDERALCDFGRDEEVGLIDDALAGDGGRDQSVAVVGFQRTLHRHRYAVLFAERPILAADRAGQRVAQAVVMFEIGDKMKLANLLHGAGWTTLTAVCLMLFSLCHNPCSTTIYTIYKETRSAKWTVVATVLPIVVGVLLCGAVALVWRLLA